MRLLVREFTNTFGVDEVDPVAVLPDNDEEVKLVVNQKIAKGVGNSILYGGIVKVKEDSYYIVDVEDWRNVVK